MWQPADYFLVQTNSFFWTFGRSWRPKRPTRNHHLLKKQSNDQASWILYTRQFQGKDLTMFRRSQFWRNTTTQQLQCGTYLMVCPSHWYFEGKSSQGQIDHPAMESRLVNRSTLSRQFRVSKTPKKNIGESGGNSNNNNNNSDSLRWVCHAFHWPGGLWKANPCFLGSFRCKNQRAAVSTWSLQ